MSGWIQLHRSLIEWEWYDDANTMRLFLHCCLRANFEDAQWRGIDIKRGDFITSTKTLSKELKLSENKIRLSIKKLISTGEITSKTTNKNTTITICNYDTYNSSKSENNKQDNKPHNKQTTNKPQTNNKQTTTDNKNNNNKQEEKYKEETKTVMNHLNQNSGKSFRSCKGLSARFNEGYTVEDVLKVIDIKIAEWGNNPDMSQYIRPETLFSNKFESYLNQDIMIAQPKKQLSLMDQIKQDKGK